MEKSLKQAAIWDELKDRLHKSALGLSGGQQQRLCIARTLAVEPEVILMDEPLKGLDIKLKLNLIRTFSRIWETDRRTVIFVTHDVEESLLLSNEILVMSRPPVQILAKQKVEIAVPDRSLNSTHLAGIKNQLIKVLEFR